MTDETDERLRPFTQGRLSGYYGSLGHNYNAVSLIVVGGELRESRPEIDVVYTDFANRVYRFRNHSVDLKRLAPTLYGFDLSLEEPVNNYLDEVEPFVRGLGILMRAPDLFFGLDLKSFREPLGEHLEGQSRMYLDISNRLKVVGN